MLVFRIAEEGVPHVGALADWEQDHHTEKWPYPVYPSAFASYLQSINLDMTAKADRACDVKIGPAPHQTAFRVFRAAFCRYVESLYPDLWSRASLAKAASRIPLPPAVYENGEMHFQRPLATDQGFHTHTHTLYDTAKVLN